MKKMLAMVVLCGLVPAASAVDVFGTDVGVTVDVEYMSRYIWRGYNKMGSSPVWKPSVDFDLGGGFGANLLAAYGHNAGTVNATEYQYTLYYGGSVLEGDCLKTDYTLGWRYYDLIDMPSKGVDYQEVFLEMDMPNLVGAGLVPHVNYYYLWQARSGRSTAPDGTPLSFASGSIVQVGADYNFTLNEVPDVPMTFSWDIVYNDGVVDKSVINGWTHMLWGLKADMQCPLTGGTLTPAVYFQNMFTRTLNDNKKDYLFCGLTYSLGF